MNPGVEKDYPLDFLSVVRHVATKLEEARPSGRALPDLASDYRPMPSDLARVKQAHGFSSDQGAIEFLVARALEALGEKQVAKSEDGYRLLREFDDLRYERKKLHRVRNDHAVLRDPFNPMSGRFVELRRKTGKDKMEELRASMKAFGWLPQLPAIQDERGVVLVGNRRLAVAEEEGIEPVFAPVLRLGSGDESDAKRFKLAIASNLGAKPFTPEERAELALYLYEDREWSMERIAEALNVSKATIGRDLSFSHEKPKERGGRPRKAEIEELDRQVEKMLDQGMTQTEIGAQFGDSKAGQSPRIAKSIGRIEGRRAEQARICRCPRCGHEHTKVLPV